MLAKHVAPSYVLTDYAKIWFEDETFLERFDGLVGSDNRASADRKFQLQSLLRLVDKLPGDTAECGVYKGASSWFICNHMRGLDKVHHAFDSFEGLSQPSTRDGDYWELGRFATSEDDARENLAGFDVAFHKGWIPDCFAEVADLQFCFVHIDVDLYQPTFDSVAFFYPRLVPGGIILLDDYGFLTCPGAKGAVGDAMSNSPDPVIDLSSGQGLVIKGTGRRE